MSDDVDTLLDALAFDPWMVAPPHMRPGLTPDERLALFRAVDPGPEERLRRHANADLNERKAAAYLLKTGKPELIEVVKAWLAARKDGKNGARSAAGSADRGRAREAGR
jgi:hypothetical protein